MEMEGGKKKEGKGKGRRERKEQDSIQHFVFPLPALYSMVIKTVSSDYYSSIS